MSTLDPPNELTDTNGAVMALPTESESESDSSSKESAHLRRRIVSMQTELALANNSIAKLQAECQTFRALAYDWAREKLMQGGSTSRVEDDYLVIEPTDIPSEVAMAKLRVFVKGS